MVAWNNYIMQKHGGSIHRNILKSYGVYARAVTEMAVDKALKRAEQERLSRLPDIRDFEDKDFFKDN